MRGWAQWVAGLCLAGWCLAGCEPASGPPSLVAVDTDVGAGGRIVGCGSSGPLVSRLLQSFSVRVPGDALVLEAPLPCEGAARALADGAVGGMLMVVGDGEPAPQNAIELARTEVTLAVGAGVKMRALSVRALGALLAGDVGRWRNGLPRHLLYRPLDHAAQGALSRAYPEFAGLVRAGARGGAVVRDEARFRSALRATPGGIGVTDVGSLALSGDPLWRVRVQGGRPIAMRIFLVLGATASPRLQAFAAFSAGHVGQSQVQELGYRAAGRRR